MRRFGEVGSVRRRGGKLGVRLVGALAGGKEKERGVRRLQMEAEGNLDDFLPLPSQTSDLWSEVWSVYAPFFFLTA